MIPWNILQKNYLVYNTGMKMKITLFFTVVLQVSLLVEPHANVEFKFVSFSNPDHRELDGDCCDDVFGWCDDFCDNRFIVCLDTASTGSQGSSCNIFRISTSMVYSNDDGFSFPSTIPNGISSIQTRRVSSWLGGLEMFVQVWDVDNNSDDLVDQAVTSVNQAAGRSSSTAIWREYTLGHQSEFRFQVRVYCNSNYYGSACSVYCIASNNHLGHYSCDQSTGAKICYSGWTGVNCNLDYDECKSNPCANGICVNGANRYDCTCGNGWTGTNCDVNVDECASTPCKNNGICNDHVASYSCSCLPGHVYADQFCEYDDCASQPCRNGSTCLDLIGTFQCICPLGFYGDLCEVDIDYCVNHTCANAGTCVDRLDGFHCLCKKGYEGFLCDVETNECDSNPCMHNATCHDLIGQYNCTCSEGYEGENCGVETDECLSSPCKNNATCEDQLAGYQCYCAPGFEGDTCATNIDECVSSPCFANETCADEVNSYSCLRENLCDYSPCQNNATCVDDYPSFICECASGYGGRTCSEDVNECASSPCMRGTCIDHLDGFSCTCPPGYAGKTCESETNECNSSPCVHGTCEDLINGYWCNCTAGYSGVTCEDDVDECSSSPCEHGRCVHGINNYTCECVVDCDHGYCAINGQCGCDNGYDGEDCSSQADYCRSSPCAKGTCIWEFNGYSCTCDQFHTGEYCTILIDDSCSFKPCVNGECETSDAAEDGYKCACPTDFYGTNCQIDLKIYGATIFVTGQVENTSQLEAKLASLLHKQMIATRSRSTRESTSTATVYVEIIRTEDYMSKKDSAPLTKVTFVARTEFGYLTKDIIEKLIEGAPTELRTEFGYNIYNGAAEPLSGNSSGQTWYIILLVLAVVAIVGAVVFIVVRRRYGNYWTNSFKARKHPNEQGLPNLEPPAAAYSTRISNDLTRPTRTNTVESLNPAYIPSCAQADHDGSGECDEGVFCNMAGDERSAAAAPNHYDEIPAFRASVISTENPYSEIKHGGKVGE